MTNITGTDYETYKEIMDELRNPIVANGLEPDILVRLHESKIIYLENLRVRCFKEINIQSEAHFSWEDYNYIVLALEECRAMTKNLVILSVNNYLSDKKIA